MESARKISDFVDELVEETTLQILDIEQCLNSEEYIDHKKICEALEYIKELGEILSPISLAEQSEHLTELINSQKKPEKLSPDQINYITSELDQIKQCLAGEQFEFSPISIYDFSKMNSK